MATPTSIGITLITIATAQSVEVSSKGEVKILTDKDGQFSKAAAQDPTFEFTIRGKGESCPIAIGNMSSGKPTGVTGKAIVTSIKNTTTNDDWEEWEAGGQAFPSAT